jgi:hypothetical protein
MALEITKNHNLRGETSLRVFHPRIIKNPPKWNSGWLDSVLPYENCVMTGVMALDCLPLRRERRLERIL